MGRGDDDDDDLADSDDDDDDDAPEPDYSQDPLVQLARSCLTSAP